MASSLDPIGPIPLYHQLKELLRSEIDAGKWEIREFPTEQELCHRFGISRSTVRQALTGLVQEGLLTRKQGKGTMVAHVKVQRNQSQFISFTQDMENQGLKPSIRLVLVQKIPAQAGLSHYLGVNPDEPVTEVTRVRLVDGEPLVLESRYFPSRYFPDVDNEDFSRPRLSELLVARYGTRLLSEDRFLEPGLADPFEAKSLGIAAGSPILRMERLFRIDSGQAVSMSVWVVRGDRCRYHVRVESPLLSGHTS